MPFFHGLLRNCHCLSRVNRFCTTMAESGLAYIDVQKNCNPFDLFREWMEESKTYGKFNTVFFNLATADRTGNVSNRTVALRDFKDNYFVIATNQYGKKYQQIKENPKISACFFWNYAKEEKHIYRQVRVEGSAIPMSFEECLEYYEKEPLFCKIRSHICKQSEQVSWEELKKQHDQLLHEIKTTNKELPMPENQIAYKIIPERFDFYFAWNENIADRIEFTKTCENKWKFCHLAA